MEIYKKLSDIQSRVKATKDLYNTFGKYNYRSAESILQAVKPIAQEVGATITLSDTITLVGERYYVTSEARITDIKTGEYVQVFASAREPMSKKGMDESQLTGSTSSYARKYALSGLLGLDDNKDADSMDNRDCGTKAEIEMITYDQQLALQKKSKEVGKTPQEMSQIIQKKFGVMKSAELSKTQFEQLMKELK